MSIELIYPGKDTATAVAELEDNWLISGPIRACIFLSNAWHLLEPKAIGKPNPIESNLNGVKIFSPIEKNHPWSQWAVLSDKNYAWLYFYACDMCEEYTKRFPHVSRHGITRMLAALENMPESIPEGEWVEPLFAKDVKYEA